MADYHPLIARAVSGLEKDTAENRRALYERARAALVAQLRGTAPALEEAEITRERLALEEAIRKVEVESARRAREAPKTDPLIAKRAAEIAKLQEAEPVAQPEQPSLPVQPAQTTYEETPTVVPDEIASEPVRIESPAQDKTADKYWTQSEHAALLDDALKEFSEVARNSSDQVDAERNAPPAHPAFLAPVPPPPPARPSFLAPVPSPPSFLPHPPPIVQTPPLQPSASPPPSPPASDPLQELESFLPRPHVEEWPPLPAEQVLPMRNLDSDEAPPRFLPRQSSSSRQAEDRERVPRSLRSYRRLIWVLIALFVVAGCVALGYWQGEAMMQAARGIVAPFRGATTQVQREATPSKPKISDRLGQPDSTPSSKSGTVATQRAMLTTEPDASNPRGKDYVGTANWRTETIPAGPGRAAELAIKLEVEIPDRGFVMTWLIRRNTDATLPASHTIDIEFNLAANSPLGKIIEIKSLLMKQPGQIEGSPLWGNAQRSTPNYFLVGLSATEADAQYNLQLLKGQPAFDVAVVFSNVRRAFLLIEKGPVGERVFAEAFAAWKQ